MKPAYLLPAAALCLFAAYAPDLFLWSLLTFVLCCLVGAIAILAWIALVMRNDPATKGEASETDTPPRN